MSGSHQVELIRFENPQGSEARLYIPKIAWNGNKLDLSNLLRDKLSRFGLLHSLYIDCSTDLGTTTGAAPSPTNLEAGPSEDHHALWFAYADYFSPNAAKSARLFLHQNLIISGQSCNVYKSRRTQTTDWPLSAANCEELANHYLGFNGWNSQLLYHRLESQSTEGNFAKMKFCSAVRLTFKCSGHHVVEGAGISEAEFKIGDFAGKGKSINFARKHSKTAALQNAFAKVILIVLDGKKVTVEVDSTKMDPFFFDPLWENHEAHVQEVDYEVPEGDEDSFVDSKDSLVVGNGTI